MVLEAAMLTIREGARDEFEAAFKEASPIIAAMPGYLSHELQQCIEAPDRYLLLVRWKTLEDHTLGFRQSAGYQEWKRLLHHFYAPFPTVDHFQSVLSWPV